MISCSTSFGDNFVKFEPYFQDFSAKLTMFDEVAGVTSIKFTFIL